MISVIIVHYKTLDMTSLTLDHLFLSKLDEELEVILVDNASNDGSIETLQERYSQVNFLLNKENMGFARANNRAIASASGEYILLLNSDVKLETDTIAKALNCLKDDPTIGVIGPKLVLASGKLDHTCKRGFPTPISSLYYFLGFHKKYPNSAKYGHYTMSHIDSDTIADVDAVVGAFMLLPQKVIAEVGVLDGTFFMYGEDLDWCYRIKQSGYRILYYPKAQALHYKGVSSKKGSYRLIYEFYRAMWIFYKKHYVKKYSAILGLITYRHFSVYLD